MKQLTSPRQAPRHRPIRLVRDPRVRRLQRAARASRPIAVVADGRPAALPTPATEEPRQAVA
jgi:hypothetical protein